jgi:CCR4-NOT transcription complex subunit 7/8
MVVIRNVWENNFNDATEKIKKLIEKNWYVAMDTEFPGIVSKNLKKDLKIEEYNYKILKNNVELLKLIQIGFSFSSESRVNTENETCWQFNFKFNLKKDMFAQDSIDLLSRSGVNFEKHEKKGICPEKFSNFLINSGLVFNKKIKWISFHSGYDFGYLVKILTSKCLPKKRENFFYLLNIFFPCLFDMKYISLYCEKISGSLNKMAEKFDINRTGHVHQAGSDSLLTLDVFFKFKIFYFKGKIERHFQGILYGLGFDEEADFFTGQETQLKFEYIEF